MSAHENDSGAPHGTRRDYVTGFLLSVVLTAIPFGLVMSGVITDSRIIAGLAMVQIVVHMVYFLHMNARSEHGWTLMALIFTVVIVVIVLAGSLWVMFNMNHYMMPPMPPQAAHGAPPMDMGGM